MTDFFITLVKHSYLSMTFFKERITMCYRKTCTWREPLCIDEGLRCM